MFRNLFLGNAGLSSVLENFQDLKGGKRLMQTIAAVSSAMARQDAKTGIPHCKVIEGPLSAGTPTTVQFQCENLFIQAIDRAQQAAASRILFQSSSTDYVLVESIVPGANLNVAVEVSALAGAAAAVDTYGANPSVDITAKTADVDATIDAINADSKLVRARKFGTGGTVATETSAVLTGGVGEAVKAYVGDLLILDTSSSWGAAAPESANGSRVVEWSNNRLIVAVSELDLVVGESIPATPTGERVANAAFTPGGMVMIRLEWTRPTFVLDIPVQVGP